MKRTASPEAFLHIEGKPPQFIVAILYCKYSRYRLFIDLARQFATSGHQDPPYARPSRDFKATYTIKQLSIVLPCPSSQYDKSPIDRGSFRGKRRVAHRLLRTWGSYQNLEGGVHIPAAELTPDRSHLLTTQKSCAKKVSFDHFP